MLDQIIRSHRGRRIEDRTSGIPSGVLNPDLIALPIEHDTDADILEIMNENSGGDHVRSGTLRRCSHQNPRILPGMEHIVAIDQKVAFGLHPETTMTGVPFGNPVVIPDRSDQP